jgi:hypothetical protein
VKLNIASDTHRMFWCPGCENAHGIRVGHDGWTCDDDVDRPTITPSVLVLPSGNGYIRACHSFVTDGRIEFLTDSDHQLAGQTVDLPDWPYP